MEDKILTKISKIDQNIVNLQKMVDDAIMDDVSATLKMLMQTKRTLTRKYVDEIHSGKIAEPTDKIPYFVTRVGGRKYKAKTLDGLYGKLFEAYTNGGLILSKTFENLFKLALEEKKQTRSAGTVVKFEKAYKRFITDELGKKDISAISNQFLKKYTSDMINRLAPIRTAYREYKSVLNLVFNYAVANDIVEYNVATKLVDSDYLRICRNDYKSAEDKAMSPEQISELTAEIYKRINRPTKYEVCYTCGFMFLLSTLTGMRAGELCSLKWKDIDCASGRIHIHTQQLKNRLTNEYEYVPWTKNEKGISKGGRWFPLTEDIKELLALLKNCQDKAGLRSEWVFCNDDGSWVKSDTCYGKFLIRLCSGKGYRITNNHAIRMYFNSYVLIPKGVSVTNRAKILGHSVEVNLKYYSFADYDYCDQVGNVLNGEILGTAGDHENQAFPQAQKFLKVL